MGKSPGKWIKTVLFGKKSSKSNLSKDSKTENKSSIAAKASSGDYGVDSMVISSPVPQVVTSEENTGIENGSTTDLAYNAVADGSSTLDLNATNEVERSRLEEAATKAQAAFRGYLARRAFWALKGIIRLQALVRGHLVRRQAVASLRCMRAIIEFQALIRGRKVRLSGAVRPMIKMYTPGELVALKWVDLIGKSLKLEKLSTNAFGIKLLASSPTAMYLSFQYDPVDPNSVWNWLERWSASRFWEPLPRPKKMLDAKPKRRQAKLQNEETELGRPKRSVRRIPAMNGDNNLSHSSETEKPKRIVRKVPSHQPESVQEQSNNELEKVKRNLRKISISTAVASERSEVATEKPPTSSEKASAPISLEKASAQTSSEKASGPTIASEKASGPTTASEKASGPPTAAEKASGSPTTSEKISGLPTTLEKVPGDGPGSPTDGTPEPWMDQTSGKVDELNLVVSKEPELETPPVPPSEDKPLVVLHDDHPVPDPFSLETNGKVDHDSMANEELTKKEDQTVKENQRTRRRKSFPAKQEYPDSISENTATLPSYMAATESAKAKLRAQAAAKTLEDGPENGFTRRHSLPSSTNSKLSLQSPRVQKPLQANGKAGSKSNKSQISPRDEKALQVGWKR